MLSIKRMSLMFSPKKQLQILPQKESWDLSTLLRASEEKVDLMKTNGAHKLRTMDNNQMDFITDTKLRLKSWLNSSMMS